MALNLPAMLLIVAMVTAVVTAVGGAKGLGLLGLLALAGIVFMLTTQPSGSFLVGYMMTFGLMMLGGAAVFGTLAGAMFRQRKFGLMLLPLLPLAYLAWQEQHTRQVKASESQQVLDFVREHKELARMTGEPFRFHVGTTSPLGKGRTKYEIRLKAARDLHAVVTIDSSRSRPDTRLECVTTLPLSRREIGKDDCAEGVVPLGDTTYARAPAPANPTSAAPPTATTNR